MSMAARSPDDRSKRRYRGPVRWLLGRDLFASLTTTLLKSVVGSRMDVRDWMHPAPDPWFVTEGERKDADEFWFDYLADTGDGYRATYSIAYLCMSDLTPSSAQANGHPLPGGGILPRGRFLFVGGDTSYHVADYNTLVARFQRPFNWAFVDLKEDNAAAKKDPPTCTRIYAIPGNHDYYNFLDGFGRQFRKPITKTAGEKSLLDLLGFDRFQECSYVALKLPFDWWFWGIDSQEGKLDKRQIHFFKKLYEGAAIKKLIVATPEPSTKFGRHAEPRSEIVKSFRAVSLPCPFLKEREKLPRGACRLDLSGDIHHYARYFGGDPESAGNYASVVSGLGGAFLHPTYTRRGPIKTRAVYPKPWESQRAIVRAMLNPVWMGTSGFVAVFAGLVSLILYFASTVAMSSRSLIEAFVKWLGLSLPPVPCDEKLFYIPEALAVAKIEKQLWVFTELAWVAEYLGVLVLLWLISRRLCEPPPDPTQARLLNPRMRTALVGSATVIPFVLLVALSFYLARVDDPHPYDKDIWLHPLICTIVVALFVGAAGICISWMGTYTEMLFSLAREADRDRTIGEGKESKGRLGREPHWLDNGPWLLLLFTAIGNVALALWRYGSYELAIMFTDLAFLTVVTIVLAIPFVAAFYGGEHLSWQRRVLLGMIGLWFSVLQVAVPGGLVMYTSTPHAFLALVVTGVLSYGVGFLSAELSTWEDDHADHGLRLGLILLAVWVALGVGLLAAIAPQVHPPVEVTGWNLVCVTIVGGGFGCIWLGWYLAVASLFGGHNNEVGGGSRIERYKQFIRFRLTAKELTGYVIAIENPDRDGRKVVEQYEVVDVFTIKP